MGVGPLYRVPLCIRQKGHIILDESVLIQIGLTNRDGLYAVHPNMDKVSRE